jgi:putative membrane protein insertion efficiency factor
MKKVLLSIVHFYRRWISPALPGSCRFAPTCSSYALEAIEKHGSLKGAALTLSRIARCHPFNPGGWDPVPPAENTVSAYRCSGVTGSEPDRRAVNYLSTSTRTQYAGDQKGMGSVSHSDTPTPRHPDTIRG